MTLFTRKLALCLAIACLAFSAPALAKTHHHHPRHHVKKHRPVKKSSRKTVMRIAQEHLANLGYYAGKIDGIMGPQTKAAIKKFQREYGLKADGIVGPRTSRALAYADSRGTIGNIVVPAPGPDMQPKINPDYTPTLNGGTEALSSRFARLDVSENGLGPDKRYIVNLNGQPILTADGQPSIIGISPTYDLGNEEAVVFTTYSPTDNGCVYKTHVLAMNDAGTQLRDIENCTRAYQARVDQGSLYITFPEPDDKRAVGATWRLEGMSLERL